MNLNELYFKSVCLELFSNANVYLLTDVVASKIGLKSLKLSKRLSVVNFLLFCEHLR